MDYSLFNTISDQATLYLVCLGRSAINAVLLFRLVNLKQNWQTNVAISALCAANAYVCTVMFDNYWTGQLIVWNVWFVAVRLLTKASVRRVGIALLVTMGVQAASTLITGLLSQYTYFDVRFAQITLQPEYQLAYLLLLCLQAILAITVIAVWFRKTATFRDKTNLTLGAWLILQGFTLYVYWYYVRSVRPLGVAPNWFIFILTASYVLLAAMYVFVSRKRIRREAAERATEAEMHEQQRRFNALSGELAVARELRHDLNNHITVLASLVRNAEREEALRYIDSLEENISRTKTITHAGGASFAALLLVEAALLRGKGIVFECEALSAQDPQTASALGPLILWAARFGDRLFGDRQFAEQERARISITFADKNSAVDCTITPCDPGTVERLLEAEKKQAPVPLEVSVKQDGYKVTLHVRAPEGPS